MPSRPDVDLYKDCSAPFTADLEADGGRKPCPRKGGRHEDSDVMPSRPSVTRNSASREPRAAAPEPLLNAERNTDKCGRDATPVIGKTQPRTYNPVEWAASGPAGEAGSKTGGPTHCCSLGSKSLVGGQWSKVHQRPLQKPLQNLIVVFALG